MTDRSAYYKEYYRKNQAKRRAYFKEYYKQKKRNVYENTIKKYKELEETLPQPIKTYKITPLEKNHKMEEVEREIKRARYREYYQKNKAKRQAYYKEYNEKNKENRRAYFKEYYRKKKERINNEKYK